jgi:hypothetical protein
VRVEDPARADERIPLLVPTPAAVHCRSCEPLLGPGDLTQGLPIGRGPCRGGGWEAAGGTFRGGRPAGPDGGPCARVPWSAPGSGLLGAMQGVSAGGASGPHARRCDAAWLRSRRDQCRAAGVPCCCQPLGANAVAGDDTDAAHADSGSRDARGILLLLRDARGGEPDEGPEELRGREFPGPVNGGKRS